jgi:hypothetical protein
MKYLLPFFCCVVFLFLNSCKNRIIKNEKDVHLCENLVDSTKISDEIVDLYDGVVTKDTIAAISLKIREAFKNRRTLSYDEKGVEDYFNDNFSEVLSFERFKNILPDANSILKKERWLSVFPIRIGIVVQPGAEQYVPEEDLHHSIDILNEAFLNADVQFKIAQIDTILSPFTIETLKEKDWDNYFAFSNNDLNDTISLYVFDNEKDLCEKIGSSIICSRTGGFSYVLSDFTNNIVLTKFEIGDQKVIAHEFGHFFGLRHTFDVQYGAEKPSDEFCGVKGDRICDTPADPGTAYEVYVNYTRCKMEGYFDENGAEYNPMINNFMSYYKPCYMKPYRFSEGQYDIIYNAAQSDIRKDFITERVLHGKGTQVFAGN